MFAQVWLRLACLWCPSGRADQRLRADLLRGCPAGPLVCACLTTVATLSRLPGFRTRRSTFAYFSFRVLRHARQLSQGIVSRVVSAIVL